MPFFLRKTYDDGMYRLSTVSRGEKTDDKDVTIH